MHRMHELLMQAGDPAASRRKPIRFLTHDSDLCISTMMPHPLSSDGVGGGSPGGAGPSGGGGGSPGGAGPRGGAGSSGGGAPGGSRGGAGLSGGGGPDGGGGSPSTGGDGDGGGRRRLGRCGGSGWGGWGGEGGGLGHMPPNTSLPVPPPQRPKAASVSPQPEALKAESTERASEALLKLRSKRALAAGPSATCVVTGRSYLSARGGALTEGAITPRDDGIPPHGRGDTRLLSLIRAAGGLIMVQVIRVAEGHPRMDYGGLASEPSGWPSGWPHDKSSEV